MSERPYFELPEHLQAGIRRYIEEGLPTGDFLRAVLCNDLQSAVASADWINRPRLAEIVDWLVAYAPHACWGSPRKHDDWIARHLLEGPLRRVVRLQPTDEPLPQVFIFCSGGADADWSIAALSQEGELLATRRCSHPAFGLHDLGIRTDALHDVYATRYPAGFELIWLAEPFTDDGFLAARAKLLELSGFREMRQDGG